MLFTLLLAFISVRALYLRWHQKLSRYPWVKFWDMRLTLAIACLALSWQGLWIIERSRLMADDGQMFLCLGAAELLVGISLLVFWLFSWVVGKVNEIFDPAPLPPENWKGELPAEPEETDES